jgi:hypothetical protein
MAFANNPFPREVNGSLWTLQPEVACYLVLMALGCLGLLALGLLWSQAARRRNPAVN